MNKHILFNIIISFIKLIVIIVYHENFFCRQLTAIIQFTPPPPTPASTIDCVIWNCIRTKKVKVKSIVDIINTVCSYANLIL